MKSIFPRGSGSVFLYLHVSLSASHLQLLLTNWSLVLHEIKRLTGACRRSTSLSIFLVYVNEMEDTNHLYPPRHMFLGKQWGSADLQQTARFPQHPKQLFNELLLGPRSRWLYNLIRNFQVFSPEKQTDRQAGWQTDRQ